VKSAAAVLASFAIDSKAAREASARAMGLFPTFFDFTLHFGLKAPN